MRDTPANEPHGGPFNPHKYVIPVEWEPQAKLEKLENDVGGFIMSLSEHGEWNAVNSSQARRFNVTKLRCECGEEVER